MKIIFPIRSLLPFAIAFGLILLLYTCLILLPEFSAQGSSLAVTSSVSGFIRHNSNPVGGVAVSISWDGGAQSCTTASDGSYSISGVPTDTLIEILVQPPLALGLAFESYKTILTGDWVKDFDLVAGYRLQGEIRKPDGSSYTGVSPSIMAIGIQPIEANFESLAMDDTGRIDLYLRPGFYTLVRNPEMTPYFLPPAIIDLRSGDLVSQTFTLRYHSGPIPIEPPDASLITIGPPDTDGFADVTGAAGAVPPLAAVMVANLNAGSLDVTASDASGAFNARLFAPPGSSILVKYDNFGDRLTNHWDLANIVGKTVWGQTVGVTDFATGELPLLPGTIIYAGENPPASESSQDYTSVGAILSGDGDPRGWAGLWFTGTLQTDPNGFPGAAVLPGETVTVTANLHVSSPDITCTPPLTFTLDAFVFLQRKFSGDGRANPDNEDFRAYMFTPTGLPISHPSAGESIQLTSITLDNWTCAGSHSFESHRELTFTLPVSLTEGIYLPKMHWISSDMPLSLDLPLFRPWYHMSEVTLLPPITVGEPAPPRLPMVLFPDYLSNGQRGLQAYEDRGKFQMINWVTFPSAQLALPRLDERTGELLTYSLEPASNWLALTDRRVPNPLYIPLQLPAGQLTIQVFKPVGGVDVLGPATIQQSSVRTPSTPGGAQIGLRSGTLGDVYQLRTMNENFAYQFEHDGTHIILVSGEVADIYGNTYLIEGSYEVMIARVLDLDPAQLPTMPYSIGDVFSPGLHLYPPVPAEIQMQIVHMPYSDPNQAITHTVSGDANRFGYFQMPAGTEIRFEEPGEFRVDISALYSDPAGAMWAGFSTWGNVVEGASPKMEAHGRRGMDYNSEVISDMPAWFLASNLPEEKKGIEAYYPYFSGDIHWGGPLPLDSIQPCISIRDLTGPGEYIYNILRAYVDNSVSEFRNPPDREPSLTNLNKRANVGEAPLFIATQSKKDPSLYPEALQLLGYWYGTSERPGVHVREVISVDMLGVGYWGFDDNYTYQIGVPADGDQPGDLKWEFGGAVLRVPSANPPVNEYAIYSSLWVLIPNDDALGGRIAPPFQDATGASVNGGPIMELMDEDIDMLFLPLGVRPGDILHLGDTISFSGHVGPPLDSRVMITITSPSNVQYTGDWHANKIGWLYDPDFDFVANETGRWTLEVFVEHDRPYIGNGVIPTSHNTGTVLGTQGQYEFYVVDSGSPGLHISAPEPGFITWPDSQIEPITFQGKAPLGTTAVHYTIHDKGIVMGQGTLTPSPGGEFRLVYDAEALHQDFPMLSLTAREGVWEGLADEVAINFLAVGSSQPVAAAVTLIGEEIFVQGGPEPVYNVNYLPQVAR